MKKLTSANYHSMPWKNGAGITLEIAVFPEHASLDEFVWRVSCAQVMDSGRFSHFPGIDRSLGLLQGAGMHLDVDGITHQVNQQNNIVTFLGDATTHARLIDGAISDFNLMSRRKMCSHHLLCSKGEVHQPLPQNTALVYCAHGAGKLISENESVDLQAHESAQFSLAENATQYSLHSDDGCFYCVQIHIKK